QACNDASAVICNRSAGRALGPAKETRMRFGDERESGNYVDDTGRGGLGFGGGGGGNPLGCLIPLVASRFGIGGVVVLLVGYFVRGSLGGLGGGGGGNGGGNGSVAPSAQVGSPAGRSNLDPTIKHFTLQVLASTEDTWGQLLKARGIGYTSAPLV